MDQITKLVELAERKAKAEGEKPFHNINDPDHRSVCWGCLFDWWNAK